MTESRQNVRHDLWSAVANWSHKHPLCIHDEDDPPCPECAELIIQVNANEALRARYEKAQEIKRHALNRAGVAEQALAQIAALRPEIEQHVKEQALSGHALWVRLLALLQAPAETPEERKRQ